MTISLEETLFYKFNNCKDQNADILPNLLGFQQFSY